MNNINNDLNFDLNNELYDPDDDWARLSRGLDPKEAVPTEVSPSPNQTPFQERSFQENPPFSRDLTPLFPQQSLPLQSLPLHTYLPSDTNLFGLPPLPRFFNPPPFQTDPPSNLNSPPPQQTFFPSIPFCNNTRDLPPDPRIQPPFITHKQSLHETQELPAEKALPPTKTIEKKAQSKDTIMCGYHDDMDYTTFLMKRDYLLNAISKGNLDYIERLLKECPSLIEVRVKEKRGGERSIWEHAREKRGEEDEIFKYLYEQARTYFKDLELPPAEKALPPMKKIKKEPQNKTTISCGYHDDMDYNKFLAKRTYLLGNISQGNLDAVKKSLKDCRSLIEVQVKEKNGGRRSIWEQARKKRGVEDEVFKYLYEQARTYFKDLKLPPLCSNQGSPQVPENEAPLKE